MKTHFSTYLFICFLFSFNCSKAQHSFQKTYGGNSDDYCFAITECADKGFIFAGYTDSYGAGANDCFITKTDSLGNIVWSKTYGGTRDDEAYSVKQTTDGGYIIAGYSNSFGAINYDAYLIKINAIGDTLWTKTYGGVKNDFANSVQQTTDGGFVLAGYTTSFVAGADSGNIYVIKTDALGNVKWTKSLGGTTAISDGYFIQQTTDKGYIITGYTNAFGESNGDTFLLKTDSSGNTSWTKTYGSPGTDWGNSVRQTNDGGYIIAGSASFDTTNLIDVYLIKTNSTGDTLWTKTYGGTGYDFGQAIDITPAGDFLIAGYTNSCDSGNYDMFILKTDINGNVIWFTENDISSDDEANYIHQTNDGGYVVAGVMYNNDNYDVYFIKTDSSNSNMCYNKSCSVITKSPHTQQTAQTIQTYTSNTAFNYVSTSIDTCSKSSSDVCATDINAVSKNNISITVFPNPNAGNFTVSIANPDEEKISISLQNILGETVYVTSIKESKEINLSHLVSGTYFLKAQSSNKTYSQKIIIIK